MTILKAILCGSTGKSIFSGFIPTMQFVEKQHNLRLEALLLLFRKAHLSLWRKYAKMSDSRYSIPNEREFCYFQHMYKHY